MTTTIRQTSMDPEAIEFLCYVSNTGTVHLASSAKGFTRCGRPVTALLTHKRFAELKDHLCGSCTPPRRFGHIFADHYNHLHLLKQIEAIVAKIERQPRDQRFNLLLSVDHQLRQLEALVDCQRAKHPTWAYAEADALRARLVILIADAVDA